MNSSELLSLVQAVSSVGKGLVVNLQASCRCAPPRLHCRAWSGGSSQEALVTRGWRTGQPLWANHGVDEARAKAGV